MAQLRIKKAHHVAPRIESARELLLPQIAGDPAPRVRRNPLAKLRENGQLGLGGLFLFHSADSSSNRRNQPLFFLKSLLPGYFQWDHCQTLTILSGPFHEDSQAHR